MTIPSAETHYMLCAECGNWPYKVGPKCPMCGSTDVRYVERPASSPKQPPKLNEADRSADDGKQ